MVNILSNPIVILLALTVIITACMFLFVGKKKKPKAKVEKVVAKKTDEKKEDKNETAEIEKTQNSDKFNEKLAQIDEKFDKVDENTENTTLKNEKKISKVYVRKQKETAGFLSDDKTAEDKYDDLSNRAEFVLTTKKISKFERFSDSQAAINSEVDTLKNDIENCEVCQDIVNHFDHSRRISDSVKNDNFDNLFASHITQHYLKIDAERHLSNNNIDVIKRVDEVIQNGQNRALDPENQEIYNNLKRDKDKLRFWLEQKRIDEESLNKEKIDDVRCYVPTITLSSLVMSDAILNRKKRHK